MGGTHLTLFPLFRAILTCCSWLSKWIIFLYIIKHKNVFCLRGRTVTSSISHTLGRLKSSLSSHFKLTKTAFSSSEVYKSTHIRCVADMPKIEVKVLIDAPFPQHARSSGALNPFEYQRNATFLSLCVRRREQWMGLRLRKIWAESQLLEQMPRRKGVTLAASCHLAWAFFSIARAVPDAGVLFHPRKGSDAQRERRPSFCRLRCASWVRAISILPIGSLSFFRTPTGRHNSPLSEMLHHVKWNSWSSDMQCAAAAGHSFVSLFLYQNSYICEQAPAPRVRFKGRTWQSCWVGDLNIYVYAGCCCFWGAAVSVFKRNLSNKCALLVLCFNDRFGWDGLLLLWFL